MKKICLQENVGDCGYACLKNLLIHYHHNNDFAYLHEDYKENMSFLEIQELGKKYNLELQGIEYKEKEEVFLNQYSICQICVGGINHFVVLEKENNNKVKIIDPKYGEVNVSKEWFLKMFTGYALIYVNHQVIEYFNKIRFLNISYLVLYVASIFIDYGLLYLLSFLMNNDTYILLLIATLAGVLFSLIGKILIIKSNYRHIDKKMQDIFIKNPSFTKSEIESLLSIKTSIVRCYYNLVNSLAIIIFSIILLAQNEILNLLWVFVIIGFVFIDYVLRKNKISENYCLNQLENDLLVDSKVDIEKYNNLSERLNKNIRNRIVSMIIIYLSSILFTFLINYFNSFVSLSYLLFASGLYFILIDRLYSVIFSFKRNRNEYIKNLSVYNRFNCYK